LPVKYITASVLAQRKVKLCNIAVTDITQCYNRVSKRPEEELNGNQIIRLTKLLRTFTVFLRTSFLSAYECLAAAGKVQETYHYIYYNSPADKSISRAERFFILLSSALFRIWQIRPERPGQDHPKPSRCGKNIFLWAE